ncbi:MAG: FAD-binding protein, partial [Bacteroidales bacterium]|nr:FAD-binding protein [Bacteroidales bacterium]
MKKIEKKLRNLAKEIQGDLLIDNLSKAVYSTDASAYRETPLGVVLPKTKEDIVKIISFAKENKISLIPRGAGTSLAGQVVGDGLVVDISRYFKKIIEVNTK